jgi:aminopeptidase YwaD
MKTLKLAITLAFLALPAVPSHGQDIQFARRQLTRLCSPEFHGRAYYKRGDSIASEYLAGQFRQLGLKSYGDRYFQDYSFNVNSLEEVSVKINGRPLRFGVDFMMHPASGSLSGTFVPVPIDAALMHAPATLFLKLSEAGTRPLVILDSLGLGNPELYQFVKTMALAGAMGICGVIEICPDVPIGRVGRSAYGGPWVQVARNSVKEPVERVDILVRNRYEEHYPTRNVIGFIPGRSEKTIVFTAHYDMIGSFGAGNYFPGASDNASGTAMVLDLARHFAGGKKPFYSMAFMLFSGEEAGLMGSTHYAGHPLFPLEQIKLVINLDMVGTGQEGVNLFNAPKRPLEAAIVQKINEEKHYMKEVFEVEATANSDHWPFHEKGVPAIFFLTRGRAGGAHNIFDTPDRLPLYGYENLFRMILDLTAELEKQEIRD